MSSKYTYISSKMVLLQKYVICSLRGFIYLLLHPWKFVRTSQIHSHRHKYRPKTASDAGLIHAITLDGCRLASAQTYIPAHWRPDVSMSMHQRKHTYRMPHYQVDNYYS